MSGLESSKSGRAQKREALRHCPRTYLSLEIEALQPRLVVAVGTSALRFFRRFDRRLRGSMIEMLEKQSSGIFTNVNANSASFDLAVVPHPRGRNRLWNQVDANTARTLQRIRDDIALVRAKGEHLHH